MSKKFKKIHYSKFHAWSTLFIVLLFLLLLFILNYYVNYYVTRDKKTFPITLVMIIIAISFISVVVFTFLVTYRGIPFMIIKNESGSKKIYYTKHAAWFTLFIVLLFLLSMFISNYYAPEDKKTFPITLVILTIILISLVIFTFIVSYREIPVIIIEKSKKTYYNKFIAWFTLFALLPILLSKFILNYYAPEDKKIPSIVLAVLTIISISVIIFIFIVVYRGIPLMVIERFKKIYYNKLVPWFTLFILLLVLLVIFISNYYAPEDKKIPSIVIVITAVILIFIVVFTFLVSYGRIPFMIIKNNA